MMHDVDNVLYLGRHRLGDTVSIPISCVDRTGSPMAPSSTPIVSIYSDSGSRVVVSSKAVRADSGFAEGLYIFPARLDHRFLVGRYRVCARFTTGLFRGTHLSTFEIVDGGDRAGKLISIAGFDLSPDQFVIGHLSTGRLVRGRNPQAR